MVDMEIDGEIIYTPPAILFDTYRTGTDLTHYNLYAGTDPQAIVPTLITNDLYLTSGNAGTGIAADGSELVGAASDLNWKLNEYSMTTFVCKVRIDTLMTNIVFFVGLSDNETTLEMPIENPGGALTSNATNAVGFSFDTAEGTTFQLVGVNNDVDETQQDSVITPVVDTYNVLMMQITDTGTATFYIDGVQVGVPMTTCMQVGANTRPIVVVSTRNAVSKTLRIDRMYVRLDPL